MRGPFIIEFRAEFSSIEGTFNNHEPTLVHLRRMERTCERHDLGQLLISAFTRGLKNYRGAAILKEGCLRLVTQVRTGAWGRCLEEHYGAITTVASIQ